MTKLQWLLVVALGLALTYELTAALSHKWHTISQMVWGLEAHMRWWAIALVVGYVVLGIHLFVRDWSR